MDEYYDPRYDPSQGRWVTYDADAGAVWEPLTVGAPLGQYITTNGDAGGQWVDNSAAERAAMNAQLEAARQAELQRAAEYIANNPLAISNGQIQTQYGERDVANFNPIVQAGQAVTGSTPTQLVDPTTNAPVYLSNPNDPYSYTYDNTGTPAMGGTVEQMAALYRPIQQSGVFGTIGGDLLSALKDPYFRNFAIAAATLGAGAALAPAAGAAGAGTGAASGAASAAGSAGFGSTLTGLGATGTQAAAGFGSVGAGLGAAGAALGNPLAGDVAAMFPGGLATPASSTSTLSSLFSKGAEALSGPYGEIIKGGLTLGGLAAASALKPKTEEGYSGFSNEELQAIVSMMPSAMGQYLSNAQSGVPSTVSAPVSMAQLFPGFSLPTTGEYGAGRFGVEYAPSAPVVGLV